jgi:hypothetical protein
MKILIVFRCDYSYIKDPNLICNNIIEYIIEPLLQQKIDFDIVFCTYPNDLDKLKIWELLISPIKIYYTESGQIANFIESLDKIKDIYNQYDYFLFLRMDIIYKVKISEWNVFKNEGLTLAFKEDSQEIFERIEYFSDIIIIISKSAFLKVKDALYNVYNGKLPNHKDESHLHLLAKKVKTVYPDIQIHTILDGYFQSNTFFCYKTNTYMNSDDERINPLFIVAKYPYMGPELYWRRFVEPLM